MSSYKMSKDEEKYLSEYDISAYERPSIATDIVIFSVLNDGVRDNIRKLQKKSLKVLLIKRASYPYKDYFALPGGFCKPGEDVCETARRELFEETNVSNAFLKLVGVYGEKDRDPRGWIISNTFMALMDGEKCKLRAGSDAWEAKWFSIKLDVVSNDSDVENNKVTSEIVYNLTLVNEYSENSISAKIKEINVFENYHENRKYEILENNGIAFDHAKIIVDALLSLRKDVSNDYRLAFDLLPEHFTLTSLQNACELILDTKFLVANFRRKIVEYVIETDKIIEGEGFRPAKLFRRNIERLLK